MFNNEVYAIRKHENLRCLRNEHKHLERFNDRGEKVHDTTRSAVSTPKKPTTKYQAIVPAPRIVTPDNFKFDYRLVIYPLTITSASRKHGCFHPLFRCQSRTSRSTHRIRSSLGASLTRATRAAMLPET